MIATSPSPPSELLGWNLDESPFHVGELQAQERVAVREKMGVVGRRVIRRFMPEQHRTFYAELPFVLVGAADEFGQPWATVLAGRPGFVASPGPKLLTMDVSPEPGDPLSPVWGAGLAVGLLGLELPTRRRNRVNGVLEATGDGALQLRVAQSFGNCPKYIQSRALTWTSGAPGEVTRSNRLSDADRQMIAAADTCFIASASGAAHGAASGADVSHRGGLPGFIVADADGVLTMPDYVGNNLFNTIGNLLVDPRAGLLFIDWATGGLLHLAAAAEIIWQGPALNAFAGARRLVRFKPHAVVRRAGALPLRGSKPEVSPFLTRMSPSAQDLGA